jgi:DNA modification methylase/protein gp37
MNDVIVARLDRAVALLAECQNAPAAKRIADVARAAKDLAQRQKLGKDAIAYANAVVVDAMTRMGEFLAAGPKNRGAEGNPGGRGARIVRLNGATAQPPTLADLGISKGESSVAQALAEMKQENPALHEEVRSGRMSANRAASRHRRQKRKAQAARALPPPKGNGGPSWEIVCGDCLTELAKLRAGSVRLAVADPPYNIGVDYGGGAKADKLPWQQYLDWCGEWMKAVVRTLTPDGSFWVLINDESAAEFKMLLEATGLHRRAWIIWVEAFGVYNSAMRNFSRCHRHLFYYSKDPARFAFDADAVLRPSDRQVTYNDKRADPQGKVWDDVWVIPRLTATCAERREGFPTQLPLGLLRPIVGCASDPGDLVLDPFSGSGSTGEAALEAGRRFLGVEKNQNFAERSRCHLLGVKPRAVAAEMAEAAALAEDAGDGAGDFPKNVAVAQWNRMGKQERRRLLAVQGPAKFNDQGEAEGIQWARWSWNPITGCLHNCPYCYARDIANRIYEDGPKFEPVLWPGRLKAPQNTPLPRGRISAAADLWKRRALGNVFVCSIADLFGRWVPKEWIDAVLGEIRAAPQWTFLLLTKFPIRMAEFAFPENAWVGTTVDCQARVANAERAFRKVKAGVKWLSCEPLLERLKFSDLGMFHWVVLGGASRQSQTPEWHPPISWVEEIHQAARQAGCRVFDKPNLFGHHIREYPGDEPEAVPDRAPDGLYYLPNPEGKA